MVLFVQAIKYALMATNKSGFRFLLLPFSILYRIIVIIRNLLYDYGFLKSMEFDIPVISVGNITVGGTGKTPHVEYLTKILKKDYTIAVLSRGYRRKTRGYKMVELDSTARNVGDEPKQIKHKHPEANICVHARRVAGIKQLKEDIDGLDAVVLDDAYQHRKVKPGVNILLIDYNRPLKEDYMLPVGELREPAYEMRRANIIIVTNTPHELKPIEKRILHKRINPYPYQDLFFSYVYYAAPKAVFSAEADEPPTTDILKKVNYQILLVSGIANPKRLTNHLNMFSESITHLQFGDHHSYRKRDLKRIEAKFNAMGDGPKIIFTTEKDAVKLTELDAIPEVIKQHSFFFPLEVQFRHNEADEFNESIYRYVETNKKHNSLFKV